MTEEQVLNIYTAFKTIPAEAREWLTSPETSTHIIAIAQQLALSDDQIPIIAFLLVRLTAQDIKPEGFRQEVMRELIVDNALAERIVDAVREKILLPIARPLQFAGVDITLLQYNAPAHTPSETPKITPPPKFTAMSMPPVTNKPLDPIQGKPFILHEESQPSMPQPSFSFTPDTATVPQNQSTPPRVIIERVVHYNNLYTPLNQKGVNVKEQKEKIRMPKSRWFS